MGRKKIYKDRPYRAEELGIEDEEDVIWGIYVGGCVDERVSWSIWEQACAHAHNVKKAPWFGWICILETKDVLTPTGKPTQTLLHEYAHLLVPDQGHTAKWKRVVSEIGAPQEVSRFEKKRTKKEVKNKSKVV